MLSGILFLVFIVVGVAPNSSSAGTGTTDYISFECAGTKVVAHEGLNSRWAGIVTDEWVVVPSTSSMMKSVKEGYYLSMKGMPPLFLASTVTNKVLYKWKAVLVTNDCVLFRSLNWTNGEWCSHPGGVRTGDGVSASNSIGDNTPATNKLDASHESNPE